MDLKTLVKAGTVDNLTEARYFTAAGAKMIGLNMDAGEGLDTVKAFQISQWLTGVSIVAEFENSSLGYIQEVIDKLKPAYVQLGESYNSSDCKSLELPVIKKVVFSDELNGQKLKEILNDFDVFAFLFDFHKMENHWELFTNSNKLLTDILKDICSEHKVLLSMDFTEKNVIKIIDAIKPYGINITGEKEIETGIKEYDKAEKIIDAIAIG